MSTSTGVKNLRAMFENRTASYDQSTSPPSRGRSSNGSASSDQSRPVSKVRTSFVAVERPGETAQSSGRVLRATSDVSNRTELQEEVIMEEPEVLQDGQHADNNSPYGQDLGVIMKGSPFSSTARNVQSQFDPQSTSQAPITTVKTNGNSNKVAALVGKMQTPASPPKVKDTSKLAKSVKAPPAIVSTNQTVPKAKDSPTLSKKSPSLQNKTPETSSPADTYASTIKTRGGVSKIQGVIASANKAKAERAKVEESRPLSNVQNPPAKISAVQDLNDAVKKPNQNADQTDKKDATSKSVVTKSTVSKPSKPAATRRSLLPESAVKKSTTERRSLAPQPPRVANVTTKASLAKKSSRASLAPAEERTKSRQSTTFKPADESFLARLTRPTASSAQKAHGKIEPTSPPRPRQVSPTHAKKAGRKSINTVANHATKPSQASNTAQDDNASLGEPGPAEEN